MGEEWKNSQPRHGRSERHAVVAGSELLMRPMSSDQLKRPGSLHVAQPMVPAEQSLAVEPNADTESRRGRRRAANAPSWPEAGLPKPEAFEKEALPHVDEANAIETSRQQEASVSVQQDAQALPFQPFDPMAGRVRSPRASATPPVAQALPVTPMAQNAKVAQAIPIPAAYPAQVAKPLASTVNAIPQAAPKNALKTSKPPEAVEDAGGHSAFVIILLVITLLLSLSIVYYTGVVDSVLTSAGIPTWQDLFGEENPPEGIPAPFANATESPELTGDTATDGTNAAIPAATDVVAPVKATGNARLISIGVNPATAKAPATLLFTIHTNDAVSNVQLKTGDLSTLLAERHSAPSGDGIIWEYSVDFDNPYQGSVYAYMLDGENNWIDSGEFCQVNVQ